MKIVELDQDVFLQVFLQFNKEEKKVILKYNELIELELKKNAVCVSK